MDSGYFTGSFKTLFSYWQDKDRAKKFTNGGTRTEAVRYLLNRAEPEIHQGVWIDTACGAGFVQKQVYGTVVPILSVGLDFSRSMLDLVPEPVERVLGSAFSLPFRKGASNLTTNIFCLSDYPDPSVAFEEMERITGNPGILMFLDYSLYDEYWTLRKSKHGDNLVGNINLRDTDEIQKYLPEDARVVQNVILESEVSTDGFDERIDLPDKIIRAFLFVELYKPRS